MNNELEPTGMSWADMVEEDLANEYDEGYVETIDAEEEETIKVQPKYNSWANMIKQEKESTDTPSIPKFDSRGDQSKLDKQENQIKKVEDEEEEEETDKNNSKEATIDDDTKKEESTEGETQGLRSSRWANAPPTKKEPKHQYNNYNNSNNNNSNGSSSNSRYFKEDSDSNYSRYTIERQSRYRDENNFRKYNNHNDGDNGYSSRQNNYDSGRRHKNNDSRRYNDDKYSNNQHQQRNTSKAYDNDDEGNWRGRSNKANHDNNIWKQSNKTDNNDKNKGLTGTSASKWASESRSSKWASEDRSSKWKNYAKTTEQYYRGNNTYTNNESTNSKENTSRSSSWKNNDNTISSSSIKNSWKNDSSVSTSNSNSSWADDTTATTSDNYTWADMKNTNNSDSKDQNTENRSSHETIESDQTAEKKSTVRITTWKDMILINGNTADSGTANQAWKSVASSTIKTSNEPVSSTQDIPTTDLNSELLDVKNDNIKLISKNPTTELPLATTTENRHDVKTEEDHSLKHDVTDTSSLLIEQSATEKVGENVNLWKQFALEHSIDEEQNNINSTSSQGSSHTSTPNPINNTVKSIAQIDTTQNTQPKSTNEASCLKHKEVEKKDEGNDWEVLQQQMMQSWST